MVIWPTAGPGCQCLQPPTSPPTTGALRLVGPVDWLVAVHCCRIPSDGGLVIFSVATVPRLVGGHYSHTCSYQLNGLLASGQGTAAC